MQTWIQIILIILGLILFLLVWISIRLFILFDYREHNKKILNYQPKLMDDKLLMSDQYLMQAKYRFFDENNFVIVYVHGLSAHIHELTWIEDYFNKIKYSYLIYSRRNSGTNLQTSINGFKLGKEIDDCLDIIKILENKFPKRRIIMIGHSLGAAIISGLANTKQIKQKNVELVIINPPSDLFFLNPFNFIEKTPASVFTLCKGILFNKQIYVEPIPKFLPMLVYCNDLCNNEKILKINDFFKSKKRLKQEHKHFLMQNYYNLRKWPFYYYANCFSLFWRTFSNISKNHVNQIWICQAEYDYFASIDKVAIEQKKLKNHRNIHFLTIEDFDHRFDPFKPKKNQEVLKKIFSKIFNKSKNQNKKNKIVL